MRTVASLLGHSQASTTLDIYAHAFDKKKREAQEKLGEVMGLYFLVRLTGFEPAAFRVGAERSIQLSYNRTSMKIVAGTRFIV